MPRRRCRTWVVLLGLVALQCVLQCSLQCSLQCALPAQRFHQRSPVHYSQAPDDNAITTLNRRLAAGELALEAAGKSGRLRALLRELAVPESSQTLVFSKTSLQRHRVSPHSPRALYFGPDVYVGWAPGATALEVAASDANLGIVFYTLAQESDEPPFLVRNDSCLSCHAGRWTNDEPGLVLRSVFPDENGDPIAAAGEATVTLRTPMAERWGGWLVTGTFAGQHRGNGIAHRDERDHWAVTNRPAVDLRAFGADFDASDYLVKTSDIGALLALEQQITVHNRLIQATLQMRCLLETDRVMNEMLEETGIREQTADIADTLAREIVEDLLLANEAPLVDHAAAANADFASDFVQQWPVDGAGLRLGALDLADRVLELPLSPMVHSAAFAAMPAALRERVLSRLWKALARGRLPSGVTVTKEQRAALHAHLVATLPGYER